MANPAAWAETKKKENESLETLKRKKALRLTEERQLFRQHHVKLRLPIK
jgi:hypothetical protein